MPRRDAWHLGAAVTGISSIWRAVADAVTAAHNPKVEGSNPSPATDTKALFILGFSLVVFIECNSERPVYHPY